MPKCFSLAHYFYYDSFQPPGHYFTHLITFFSFQASSSITSLFWLLIIRWGSPHWQILIFSRCLFTLKIGRCFAWSAYFRYAHIYILFSLPPQITSYHVTSPNFSFPVEYSFSRIYLYFSWHDFWYFLDDIFIINASVTLIQISIRLQPGHGLDWWGIGFLPHAFDGCCARSFSEKRFPQQPRHIICWYALLPSKSLVEVIIITGAYMLICNATAGIILLSRMLTLIIWFIAALSFLIYILFPLLFNALEHTKCWPLQKWYIFFWALIYYMIISWVILFILTLPDWRKSISVIDFLDIFIKSYNAFRWQLHKIRLHYL